MSHNRPKSAMLVTYYYEYGSYSIFYKGGKHVRISRSKAGSLLRVINNLVRSTISVHSFDINSYTIYVEVDHI